VPRFVGPRLGTVGDIDIEISLETGPSVLFDAVVLPDGEAAEALAKLGHALEFLKDQYRHCKTILAIGAGAKLLEAANIPESLADGKKDPGILRFDQANEGVKTFIAAVARHRHPERYSDPPRV
ncbi:MAG TPA: DJ-1/PfpI family protein, partial [Steroidobacteraceae bacterium]|nr:DJ-1/PfpI family protein [Steroidobacteraceae bacterium]